MFSSGTPDFFDSIVCYVTSPYTPFSSNFPNHLIKYDEILVAIFSLINFYNSDSFLSKIFFCQTQPNIYNQYIVLLYKIGS